MIQNLQDTAKAVLRGKFIAIQAHLKKQEINEIEMKKTIAKINKIKVGSLRR